MARRGVIAVHVLLALGLWGCTPDFEDPWLVKDLRILGINATPPEQILRLESGDVTTAPREEVLAAALEQLVPVDLQLLAVDPRDPDREVAWEVWACTPEEGFCDGAALEKRLASGRTLPGEIRHSLLPDPELLLASLEADPFRGFGGLPVIVEFRVVDDGSTAEGGETFTVAGFKRVVYTFPLPYSPVPEAKSPNNNPAIEQIKANDQSVDLSAPLEVTRGSEIVLEPVPTEGSKETYIVVTAENPFNVAGGESQFGEEQLEEFLGYSFFTTVGKLSHGTTGGKPLPFVENEKIDDITSTWTVPDEPGEATLWVVIRDDRGGAGWESIRVTIVP